MIHARKTCNRVHACGMRERSLPDNVTARDATMAEDTFNRLSTDMLKTILVIM